jgi:RNA polymerase sigma factor (sigma-70 family)
MSKTANTELDWDREIARYEGLVRKTAARHVNFVEEEFDDICAILRVKVWKALTSYDPAKATQTQDGYVFSCVVNQCKDLLKRKPRNEAHIEDFAYESDANQPNAGPSNSFEARYLQLPSEHVYGAINEGALVLPTTLSEAERQVVGLLYLDYTQKEAIAILGMTKRQMENAVRAIREKLADWDPASGAEVIPLDALPRPVIPPALAA